MTDAEKIKILNQESIHLATMVARLTREVIQLVNRVSEYAEFVEYLERELICIGGPLNDNVAQFDRRQLALFQRIRSRMPMPASEDATE